MPPSHRRRPGIATALYRFRKSVARIERAADGLSIAIYDRANDWWVDFPAIYGYLTGLGGDPPVGEITRDEVLSGTTQDTHTHKWQTGTWFEPPTEPEAWISQVLSPGDAGACDARGVRDRSRWPAEIE